MELQQQDIGELQQQEIGELQQQEIVELQQAVVLLQLVKLDADWYVEMA